MHNAKTSDELATAFRRARLSLLNAIVMLFLMMGLSIWASFEFGLIAILFVIPVSALLVAINMLRRRMLKIKEKLEFFRQFFLT